MKHKLFIPALSVVVLAFLLLGSNISFASGTAETIKKSDIVKITSATYDAEIAKGIVLVDFWATWCGPCLKMNPVLEAVAKEYKGVAKIAKIDVDENKELANKLKISSIPAIIVYKDGKEVDRIIGVVPQSNIEKAIAAQGGVKK